jgi:hypothetical protein
MKTYGRVDVHIHAFLISALVGEQSASRPGRFSLGFPEPIEYEAGKAPELVWTIWRSEKFLTLPRLETLHTQGINRNTSDRLCGLVVRVPGYISRDPGFDSRRYQNFWEVVGLERGPLSLLSAIEGLLGRTSNSSCLDIREYGRGDPFGRPRDILYQQKLALTSQTNGGRSVGIIRWRTEAMEFSLV